jgi:hypothetical protein
VPLLDVVVAVVIARPWPWPSRVRAHLCGHRRSEPRSVHSRRRTSITVCYGRTRGAGKLRPRGAVSVRPHTAGTWPSRLALSAEVPGDFDLRARFVRGARGPRISVCWLRVRVSAVPTCCARARHVNSRARCVVTPLRNGSPATGHEGKAARACIRNHADKVCPHSREARKLGRTKVVCGITCRAANSQGRPPSTHQRTQPVVASEFVRLLVFHHGIFGQCR